MNLNLAQRFFQVHDVDRQSSLMLSDMYNKILRQYRSGVLQKSAFWKKKISKTTSRRTCFFFKLIYSFFLLNDLNFLQVNGPVNWKISQNPSLAMFKPRVIRHKLMKLHGTPIRLQIACFYQHNIRLTKWSWTTICVCNYCFIILFIYFSK